MSNLMQLNGKTVTASEYYYGCDVHTWDEMPYPEAIEDRRKRAFELYIKLDKAQRGMKYDDIEFEDKVRLFKVEKAMKDTKQLCEERNLVI